MNIPVALFAAVIVAGAAVCAWTVLHRTKKAQVKRVKELADKRARYARQNGQPEALLTAPLPRPKLIFGRR